MPTVLTRTVPAVPGDVLKWCVDSGYSLVSSKITNAAVSVTAPMKMIGRVVKGTPGAFILAVAGEEASVTGIIVGPVNLATKASFVSGATSDEEYAVLYRGPALYDNLLTTDPAAAAFTMATIRTALAAAGKLMTEVENPPVTGTQDT